ncbi:DUF6965 family protein [Flavobacterium tistrianum]|uniref:DUF6965 family protein n=1 Tax=Flavobacterium tistrianum TaxID=1685414 RepID=UPI000DAEBA51|nr:hypothetical protein [Flavobacterium tistrianum]KAF2342962.1 hypothetical protein DMB71_01030 [Flavobacterium tistrianum]
MNPEEIKRYFDANPPPLQADWKPWAKITDSQLFLKSCYTGIRTFNGSLDMCPAWWHLKDFYLLIKRSAPQDEAQEGRQETES